MEVVADSDIDKNGADNNCVGNDNIGKDDNIAKDDSEKIKNQQNNPEIEDPDFDIGQETASFENDSLKISYKRTKLKKFEHFNLTEYNSSINIALKRDHQSIFMTSALHSGWNPLSVISSLTKKSFCYKMPIFRARWLIFCMHRYF